MEKGTILIVLGIFLILIGSLISMMNVGSGSASGIFVIFPFVFIIGGPVDSWFITILLVVVFVMFIIPFLLFFKLSAWPFTENFSDSEAVSQTKVCPVCGTVVPIEAKYCYNCGYAFHD